MRGKMKLTWKEQLTFTSAQYVHTYQRLPSQWSLCIGATSSRSRYRDAFARWKTPPMGSIAGLFVTCLPICTDKIMQHSTPQEDLEGDGSNRHARMDLQYRFQSLVEEKRRKRQRRNVLPNGQVEGMSSCNSIRFLELGHSSVPR